MPKCLSETSSRAQGACRRSGRATPTKSKRTCQHRQPRHQNPSARSCRILNPHRSRRRQPILSQPTRSRNGMVPCGPTISARLCAVINYRWRVVALECKDYGTNSSRVAWRGSGPGPGDGVCFGRRVFFFRGYITLGYDRFPLSIPFRRSFVLHILASVMASPGGYASACLRVGPGGVGGATMVVDATMFSPYCIAGVDQGANSDSKQNRRAILIRYRPKRLPNVSTA